MSSAFFYDLDDRSRAIVSAMGNNAAQFALSRMRMQRNEERLRGWPPSEWTHPNTCGQILVAEFDMHGDPLVCMAARNEARFLARGYGK